MLSSIDIRDIFNLLSPLTWKYATDILSLLDYRTWINEIHFLCLSGYLGKYETPILSLLNSLGCRHETHTLNYRLDV